MARAMRAAGIPDDKIVDALIALAEERLANGRARQAKHRENKRNACNVTDVTRVSKKRNSPTPPKEKNNTPPEETSYEVPSLPPTGGPTPAKRGSRLPDDWKIPPGTGETAQEVGLSEADVRAEAAKFRDYWVSKPGQGGVKLDWTATWRNWLRKAAENKRPVQRQGAPPDRPVMMADYAANLLKTIEAKRNDEPAEHNGPEIESCHG